MKLVVVGAVTGSIISLGLVYGYDKPNSTEQNDTLVEKVHEYEKLISRSMQPYAARICSVST